MAEDLLAHRAILQAGGWQLIDLVKQVDKTAHQIWIQPTLNTEHLSCRIRHSAAEQQDTHFLVSIPVTARRALDALAALDPTIPPEQTESAYPALAEFGASVHAAAAANPEEPGELLAPGHEHAPEEPLTSEKTGWTRSPRLAGSVGARSGMDRQRLPGSNSASASANAG